MNERYTIQVDIFKRNVIQPVRIEYRRQIVAL